MNHIYLSNSKSAIIIPIKNFDISKSRLSSFLSIEQRKILCTHLITNLLNKLSGLERVEIIIITDECIDLPENIRQKTIIIEEHGATGVNNAIALSDSFVKEYHFDHSIVIPIDIPLVNVAELEKIIQYSAEFKEGICIVPSFRFDGTNILLRKPHSVIQTSYDNNSFFNHIKNALEKDVTIKIFDPSNLSLDIDNVEDIPIVLRRYFLECPLALYSFDKDLNNSNIRKNDIIIDYLLELLTNYQQNF